MQSKTDNIEDTLLADFISSIGYVVKPENPGKRYEVANLVKEISISSALLVKVIEFECEEDSLSRLQSDFGQHVSVILELSDFTRLPIAIEGLAQKLEAFIKKIAYLRYYNSELWNGNDTSAGIQGTSLKGLCDGVLSNKYGVAHSVRPITLPEALFDYKGVKRNLVDFVRQKLRNAVHYAPSINRKDLIPYAEIVLLVYIIIIEDNKDFLSKYFFTGGDYLDRLVSRFSKVDNVYVPINSTLAEHNEFTDFSPELVSVDWQSNDDVNTSSSRGTIVEVFSSVNRLVILGGAGQGKTTSLQFITIQLAKNSSIVPLYFAAKDYDSSNDLWTQLAIETGMEESDLRQLCHDQSAALLIDGLNELIVDEDRFKLTKEIRQVLKQYQSLPCAITTRPQVYQGQLEIPAYELLPLSNSRMRELLVNYYATDGESLYNLLGNAPRLMEICRNPLMLRMIGSYYSKDRQDIPENKGQLIRAFIEQLLKREQIKNLSISLDKFRYMLIYLGYQTRCAGNVGFSYLTAIEELNQAAKSIDPNCDRVAILDAAIELNLIDRSGSNVSFRHEMFQEYFAAEGLLLFDTIETVLDKASQERWNEPIQMYSGYCENPDVLVKTLVNLQPRLAANCLISSLENDPVLVDYVVTKNVEIATSLNDPELSTQALLSLIDLGYSEDSVKSIEKNINESRQSFKVYTLVCTELIRSVDVRHIENIVVRLLQLNDGFAKMILRGIGGRNDTDSTQVHSSLKYICENWSLQGLSRRYVKILLIGFLDEQEVSLLPLQNLIIKLLDNQITTGFPVLDEVEKIDSELANELVEPLLKSDMIRAQIDAISFCVRNEKEREYSELLNGIELYQDVKILNEVLDLSADSESFYQGIAKIENMIRDKAAIKKLKSLLNKEVRCLVLGGIGSKKAYISLKIPGEPMSNIKMRLNKNLVEDSSLYKSGRNVNLVVQSIDERRRIVRMSISRKQDTKRKKVQIIDSDKIEPKRKRLRKPRGKIKMPAIGDLARCMVQEKHADYLVVVSTTGWVGQLQAKEVQEVRGDFEKVSIGDWMTLTVESASNTDEVRFAFPNKVAKKPVKPESDIAIKLRQALSENPSATD